MPETFPKAGNCAPAYFHNGPMTRAEVGPSQVGISAPGHTCTFRNGFRLATGLNYGKQHGWRPTLGLALLFLQRGRRRRWSARCAINETTLVPVVDLDGLPWLGGKPPDHLVAAVRHACSHTGFFLVTNHGVPSEVAEALLESASHFFAQPLAEKQALIVHGMERSRGWEMSQQHLEWQEKVLASPVAGAGTSLSAAQGIMTERFSCGPACCELSSGLEPQDSSAYGRVFFAENVWPASCPGLRASMRRYYTEMERLSRGLLALLAAAAGAPWQYFEGPLLQRHSSNLQVAHYPAIPPQWMELASDGLPLRVKAHADSGTLTLLHRAAGEQDRAGGLEILHHGAWHRVPSPAGALCVNVGNLMQHYTGGLFHSTKHRVARPEALDDDSSNVARYSIAYFQKPDYTALCQPIGDGLLSPLADNFPPTEVGKLSRVGFLWWQRAKGLSHPAAVRSYHRRMFPGAHRLPAALLLDCDGVLADTEPVHREAFNSTFHELGIGVLWSEAEYGQWIQVSGAKERCAAFFEYVGWPPEALPDRAAFLQEIQRRQNAFFRAALHGGRVAPRPGITRVVAEAHTVGVPVAVVSSSTRAVVEAVVASLGLQLPIFAGDMVPKKKPSPDIYFAAAQALGVVPSRCVAVEDSPTGLAAAFAAGIPCAITEAVYTRGAEFPGAGLVAPSLAELSFLDLAALVPFEGGEG